MSQDDEAQRVMWATAENERRLRRERARRPYVPLPPGHPDTDAEDLPYAWQRWAAEGAGVVVLVAVMIGAIWLAVALQPTLPAFLDWLTGLLF